MTLENIQSSSVKTRNAFTPVCVNCGRPNAVSILDFYLIKNYFSSFIDSKEGIRRCDI
jgi:hypothetical protein